MEETGVSKTVGGPVAESVASVDSWSVSYCGDSGGGVGDSGGGVGDSRCSIRQSRCSNSDGFVDGPVSVSVGGGDWGVSDGGDWGGVGESGGGVAVASDWGGGVTTEVSSGGTGHEGEEDCLQDKTSSLIQ